MAHRVVAFPGAATAVEGSEVGVGDRRAPGMAPAAMPGGVGVTRIVDQLAQGRRSGGGPVVGTALAPAVTDRVARRVRATALVAIEAIDPLEEPATGRAAAPNGAVRGDRDRATGGTAAIEETGRAAKAATGATARAGRALPAGTRAIGPRLEPRAVTGATARAGRGTVVGTEANDRPALRTVRTPPVPEAGTGAAVPAVHPARGVTAAIGRLRPAPTVDIGAIARLDPRTARARPAAMAATGAPGPQKAAAAATGAPGPQPAAAAATGATAGPPAATTGPRTTADPVATKGPPVPAPARPRSRVGAMSPAGVQPSSTGIRRPTGTGAR